MIVRLFIVETMNGLHNWVDFIITEEDLCTIHLISNIQLYYSYNMMDTMSYLVPQEWTVYYY